MTISTNIKKTWDSTFQLINKEKKICIVLWILLPVSILLLYYAVFLGLTTIFIWGGLIFWYIDMQSKNRKIVGTWLYENGFSDVLIANSDNFGQVFLITTTSDFIVCECDSEKGDKILASYSSKEYTRTKDKNAIYIIKNDGSSEVSFSITKEQKKQNIEFNRHFAKTVYSKDRMMAYNMQNSSNNFTFKNY